MPTYFAIFTTTGLARLATAQATGIPLVFTHVAVGDGNGSPITPTAGMTALVHEVARVGVNAVDLASDADNTVRVEGLIPAATGGFTIREAGLFNGAGELIAVANYPPIYKPTPSDGVTADEYIRILLVYDAVTAIALSVDPSVIMATREYVDALTTPRDMGDGSDGDCVLDGINTFPWATLSGSTYTATRCPACEDLTISSGIELKMAGFVGPLWRGTLTNAGIISHDGSPGGSGSAGGGAAGAGAVAGSMLGGFAGAVGTTNSNGTAGTNATDSLGGAGGAGGFVGGVGGLAGGTVTAPSAALGPTRTAIQAQSGYIVGNNSGTPTLTAIRGGAGGAGGGGVTSSGQGGGGGGGGGGNIRMSGNRLVNNGTIRAKGGDGGPSGDNFHLGGGGGGGGSVSVSCRRAEGTGTIVAPGGAGGTSLLGGGDGVAGSAGTVMLNISSDHLLAIDEPHAEEGKAEFSAADTVVITFPNAWSYASATGPNGYKFDRLVPYITDDPYDGVTFWITDKTRTGFTIRASAPITAEVDWKTVGF